MVVAKLQRGRPKVARRRETVAALERHNLGVGAANAATVSCREACKQLLQGGELRHACAPRAAALGVLADDFNVAAPVHQLRCGHARVVSDCAVARVARVACSQRSQRVLLRTRDFTSAIN